MDDKRMILEELAMDFDLERIRFLALPEKFQLLNHIKLVRLEAERAEKQGIGSLRTSENYTVNKTFNLFAMLLVNDLDYDTLKEIVLNYARNFEKSDTYYAQIAVLGIGVLLIRKGMEPDAILNFLMSLMGEEFLLGNLKYCGRMDAEELRKFQFERDIVYKPFEGDLRKVKYQLLALLRIREEKGLEAAARLIDGSFADPRLKFYYNMMAVAAPEVRDFIYDDLKATPHTVDQLRVCGAYAILTGMDVFSVHYLFNSLIGKYSRHDKDSGEIEQELMVHLKEIEARG